MDGYEPLGGEVMEAKLVDIHLKLVAAIENVFPNKITFFFSGPNVHDKDFGK